MKCVQSHCQDSITDNTIFIETHLNLGIIVSKFYIYQIMLKVVKSKTKFVVDVQTEIAISYKFKFV